MALLVDEILDEARDQHSALSESNAPTELLLRELTRRVREIYTKLAPRMPEFLLETAEVDMSTVDFSTGAAIDLGTLIPGGWLDLPQIGFTWQNQPVPGAGQPVKSTWRPWQQRQMAGKLPAHSFEKNVLHLIGSAQAYAQFGLCLVSYIPIVAPLEEGGTLDLPDDAKDFLSLRVAAFGMRRLVGNPQFDVDKEQADDAAARGVDGQKDFQTRVFRLTQRQDGRMRDVNPDPGGPWMG